MTIIRAPEGHAVDVLGDGVVIKLASERSPHGMAVVLVTVPPGSFLPPVAHREEEEIYFVLEGRLLMHFEGQEVELGRWDMAHVPPGTFHGYRNDGEQEVRFLSWTVGGPMDQFFVEMSRNVKSLPQDGPKMAELLDRFGITMPGGPAEP
jgi:mannose-6-phosphate isomerase-like protein (cupin superfamily)